MVSGSVILVTYNSSDCIAACLHALRAADDWDVILVDNASTDSTADIAEKAFADVRILVNKENRGFAAAVNQGFEATESDVCVVLNPDVIAHAGSLDRLARCLAPEHIGAAGGLLTESDGLPQKGFIVRRLPTLMSAMAEVLLLNRLWPGNPINRRYRYLDFDYTQPREVEQPAGACLAIKRSVWKQLGGFDESFFPVWFEDVDFCHRLLQQNRKIMYCPEAVFQHAGGHSVHKLAFGDRQAIWYRNLLHYFRKHHGRTELLTLRAAVATGLVLRSLMSLCGVRPRGISLRQSLAAYFGAAWSCALVGKNLPPGGEMKAFSAKS